METMTCFGGMVGEHRDALIVPALPSTIPHPHLQCSCLICTLDIKTRGVFLCNFLEAYARMRGSSQIHFLSTNLVFQIELSLLYGKDSSEVPKPEHDDEGI